MSALLITLAVLAGIASYLAMGALLAVRAMPGVWERARLAWCRDESARQEVVIVSAITLLAWPLFVPARRLWLSAAQVIDARHPMALQRQVAERDRRIADLERELGIGRRG